MDYLISKRKLGPKISNRKSCKMILFQPKKLEINISNEKTKEWEYFFFIAYNLAGT